MDDSYLYGIRKFPRKLEATSTYGFRIEHCNLFHFRRRHRVRQVQYNFLTTFIILFVELACFQCELVCFLVLGERRTRTGWIFQLENAPSARISYIYFGLVVCSFVSEMALLGLTEWRGHVKLKERWNNYRRRGIFILSQASHHISKLIFT